MPLMSLVKKNVLLPLGIPRKSLPTYLDVYSEREAEALEFLRRPHKLAQTGSTMSFLNVLSLFQLEMDAQ
jgi:hypothetical protein